MPSNVLPIRKKNVVTKDPNQTYFHLTLASGSILYIAAKRIEIIQIVANMSSTLKSQIKEALQCSLIQLLEAASKDVITSDMSSRNATDKINPNENKRRRINLQKPDFSLVASTSQMMFSDFCN